MKWVYVSNYMNHHVQPLCDELFRRLGTDFCFIQTDEMTKERRDLGWGNEQLPTYVIKYMQDRETCDRLIMESDIAMIGWSSLPFSVMKQRFTNGKPAFRLSERIYKEGQWKRFSPRGLKAKEKEHGAFRDYPVYLLCVGAYVASDFRLIHAYPEKMYRFGYFTEVGECDFRQWTDSSVVKLLWTGRLMELKHPEYALHAAAELKRQGIAVQLDLVGDGPLRTALEQECRQLGLEEQVVFHGALQPKEVRQFMKSAAIFLFTSNYLEGWGAVVGEAMSCGCAVVASAEAGAVPFLIHSGQNGLTYEHNSYKEFLKQVLLLANDSAYAQKLGMEARQTVETLWNAETAVQRLLCFCEEQEHATEVTTAKSGARMTHRQMPHYEDEGPLTPAPILKAQSFFRTLQEKNHQDHG